MIYQIGFSENSLLGKQEAMFEIDGNTYVISNMGGSSKKDPLPLKDIGTRISCDILTDVTGQRVLNNESIQETSSFISGNKLSVDCIEPYSGIAVDYLSKEFYRYNGKPPNKDVYEFYDRVALNQFKKEKLNESGIKYVTVPYTVDHCSETGVCDNNPSINIRKQRIRDYISARISNVL